MKIHHTRLLYCRQGYYQVCLTLPNNIGRMERLLDVFSTLRIFLFIKIYKMSSFDGFLRQKICAKLKKHLKVFPHVLYCQEVSNTPNSDLVYNIEAQYGVFSYISAYIRLTSLFTVWSADVIYTYVTYICYVEGCKFSTSTHVNYHIVQNIISAICGYIYGFWGPKIASEIAYIDQNPLKISKPRPAPPPAERNPFESVSIYISDF